ncbi:MAG: hypothetical protein NC434_10200 [Ruminococcus sp.]|nr:hypothetical protein [Ruminococcus sp.]
MKKWENKLDEMQEQKLLQIEHNGYWLAFWGLFISLIVQLLIYGPGCFENCVGEWIVFMCIAVYMVAACLKNGIWDRRFTPKPATHLLLSLLVGVFCGVMQFIVSYRRYGMLAGSVAAGIVLMGMAFVLCYAGFAFSAFLYHRKVNKLESEMESEAESEGEVESKRVNESKSANESKGANENKNINESKKEKSENEEDK